MNWTTIVEVIRRVVMPVKSPIFITMLALSFIMWYALKLSYVYTTELSVPVKIDGERYRIKCMVEARGTEIWVQRLAIGGRTSIALSELSPQISTPTDEYYTIAPSTLGNAIMQHSGALRVIEVLEAPEIPIFSTEK